MIAKTRARDPRTLRVGRRWAVAALAIALAGCGRAHEVTVYTTLEPELADWARGAFEAGHRDVGLRFERVTSAELLSRLRADREDPAARVVWGAPSWLLATAAEEGLLAAAAPSWAAALPERLRDPEGRWAASLVDPIVLAFDHGELSRSRAPRDWVDLFHPRFAGDVLVPEPGADDGGTALFAARAATSMAQHGDILDAIDWYKRLDGQARRYEADEVAMLRRFRRGDGRVAPARLSRAEAAAGDGVAYVVPESGAPLLVQGVAITAGTAGTTGAEGMDPARSFVEWLGGVEATEGLSGTLHRVPATLVANPAGLSWLVDAATALGGEVPDADTLAAHLDAWLGQWRREARGRGVKLPPGG